MYLLVTANKRICMTLKTESLEVGLQSGYMSLLADLFTELSIAVVIGLAFVVGVAVFVIGVVIIQR